MNNIRKSFCGTKKSLFVLYCAHLFVPLPPEMNKNLYIISGCNGAGKTTASYTVLPEILDCKEFVNADEIARGLSPFNPESVAIEAGRLMLKRIDELSENPRKQIASGGRNADTVIDEEMLYLEMQSYVK